MLKKSLLVAVVAGVFLGGCAAMHEPPRGTDTGAAAAKTRLKCNQAWCTVYVRVGAGAAGAPVVSVDFDEIAMADKFQGATLLWLLVGSPQYQFCGDSIKFKGQNVESSAAQFPVRESSAHRISRDNKNNNRLIYTYEVRVYPKDAGCGGRPLVLDPTIANDF